MTTSHLEKTELNISTLQKLVLDSTELEFNKYTNIGILCSDEISLGESQNPG